MKCKGRDNFKKEELYIGYIYIYTQLTQEETENQNNPIAMKEITIIVVGLKIHISCKLYLEKQII